jgi:hypothetical protein
LAKSQNEISIVVIFSLRQNYLFKDKRIIKRISPTPPIRLSPKRKRADQQ